MPRPIARGEPPVVEPAPLPFAQGQPLSQWTLVETPEPLEGLVSWTVETRRHRGRLRAMALSPNGKLLATGGQDATIRLWDAATGKLVRILVAHDYHVDSLSWSPDGKLLASAGTFDKTVRLWDAASGLLLRTFTELKDYVDLVRWSHDGRRLAAAGGFSGWIWTWDAAANRARVLTEVGQQVRDLDWSPDGSRLSAVVINAPTSVLDAATGKSLQTLGEHQAATYCARWSPDGGTLAVGSEREAALYTVASGKVIWQRPGASWAAQWSSDGKRLAMMRTDGVHIMTREDGKTTRTLRANAESVQWRGADSLLTCRRTSVMLSDPLTGKSLASYWLAAERPPLWLAGRPIVSGLGTKTLRLWDSTTAASSWELAGHTASVACVAWQNTGNLLASSALDKTIRLWDTTTGKLLHTWKDLSQPATQLAWSPDDKTLASAGSGHEVNLTSAMGERLGQLAGHSGPVTALAWSRRGDVLASGSDDQTVALWDPANRKLLRKLPAAREVRSLALHPGGTLLACGTTDEVVQLWLVGSGKPVRKNLLSPGGETSVTSLDWLTPDGRLLLAGRANMTIQVWDWRQAEAVRDFWAYAPVEYVSFSKDGSLVVAGAAGRAAFVWRRVEGQLKGAIIDQGNHVLLLNADGNYRQDPSARPDIVFVAQTRTGQLTLSPAEFSSRYGWTNHPDAVKFSAAAAAATHE